ncbi:MAG: ribonuclease HII [Ruminococcus sp.]|nr:ribonuclease HII [Ruminococcus sp.]
MTLYEFDENIKAKSGAKLLCGVDEAGRGPLAGDVYAAAVIFPVGVQIDGINESKKLSEKKREALYDEIISSALAYSICTSSVSEIEEINILNAAMLAMKRAVESLDALPDLVLIDGNKTPDISPKAVTVVKGDAKSQCIAAASVLAKVSRDRYMKQMDTLYPEYQFSKHKGYGTKLHYEMVDKYGLCEIHRPSFFKKYFEKKNG